MSSPPDIVWLVVSTKSGFVPPKGFVPQGADHWKVEKDFLDFSRAINKSSKWSGPLSSRYDSTKATVRDAAVVIAEVNKQRVRISDTTEYYANGFSDLLPIRRKICHRGNKAVYW